MNNGYNYQGQNNGVMNPPTNNEQMLQQTMYNQQPMYNGQQMYNQQPMYNSQPMYNTQNNKPKSKVGIIIGVIVAIVVIYFVYTIIVGNGATKGTWHCDLDGSSMDLKFEGSKNLVLSSGGIDIKSTYEKKSYTPEKEYKKSGYYYKLLKINATEYVYNGTSTPYTRYMELAIGAKGDEAHIISRDNYGTYHQGTCKR